MYYHITRLNSTHVFLSYMQIMKKGCFSSVDSISFLDSQNKHLFFGIFLNFLITFNIMINLLSIGLFDHQLFKLSVKTYLNAVSRNTIYSWMISNIPSEQPKFKIEKIRMFCVFALLCSLHHKVGSLRIGATLLSRAMQGCYK